MSAQNGEKKLSMSLDDIIKMNRKQNPRTGGGGGGNNNNNRRNNNFAGGNNNNRRFNNNNRRQGGGGGGPRNNNNNNRPKFGMLNRSKTIGKNNRVGGGRPNNVGGGNRFNNGPKRQNNRPRFQNQANRFNNRPQIQQQPQQQQPKPQQPRPQQTRPQQPRQQNRAVGGGIANKLSQRIRQQRAGNKLGRVGGVASRGLARLNTFRSNKIAMQAARKNVQKAKRLLTTNRRTQQIKPRRFQNPGNPNAQNKVRLAGRRLPNKTANGDNRLNAIRKQIQRQKIQQRQQKIGTNRPILNRNRGNNRMVMG